MAGVGSARGWVKVEITDRHSVRIRVAVLLNFRAKGVDDLAISERLTIPGKRDFFFIAL